MAATSLLHLTVCVERDPPTIDRPFIHRQVADLLITDAAIELRAGHLRDHYSPAQIDYYDLVSLGFMATANLLASQVPLSSPIDSYLDLGTGTGTTALACSKVLMNAGNSFGLFLVDGLQDMLVKAMRKFDREIPEDDQLRGIYINVREVLGDLAALRADIQRACQVTAVSLITAQRVFLNVRKDRRSQQLRQWAAFLRPGGTLIVDVPHPRRHLGAMFLGTAMVDPNATHPPLEICRLIADDETWQECRDYAQQLATDANLVITNTLPAHLPPAEDQEDGRPAFRSWVAGCQATTLLGSLSRDEAAWFANRYCQAAVHHYRSQGFTCSADIAAVVAVFEHAPIPVPVPVPVPPTATDPHTKYDIDESLSGKARKNAKRRAAREAKQKAHERDNHDNEGAGGAGAMAGA